MKIKMISMGSQVECPQKSGHTQVHFDLHGCLSIPKKDVEKLSPRKLLNLLVKMGHLSSDTVIFVPQRPKKTKKIKTGKGSVIVPVS